MLFLYWISSFCGVMDGKVDVKGAYDSPKTAENFCNKKVLSCVD
jgi:hypothetical protein